MKILYHEKRGPLLLNIYQGAAVGYSVRKINRNYHGYCIDVRRSSDNAIRSIAFRNDHLDEIGLLNFIGSGNGYVKTWYDQSGNGNNAVQTNEANQPIIAVSGTILKDNNKPAIYFDGTNHYIPLTSAVEGDTDFSTFNVIHRDDAAFNMFLFNTDIPAAVGPYSVYQYGDRVYCCNTRMSSYYIDNLFEQVLFSTHAVSYVNYMFKNSVSKALINPGGTFPNDIDVIGRRGSAYYSKGYIQEGIWYQTDKRTDRVGIENNINDYFSIY